MAYFRCGGGGGGVISGTATNADISYGKTIEKDGEVIFEGTMPNRGTVTQTLNCGESYTIPAGQHSGSGTVTANSLASQTGVDTGKTAIDASHVVDGYQGWVNGTKISGTAVIPTADVTKDFTISASSTVDNGNGQKAVLTVSYVCRATYNPTTGTITLARVSGNFKAQAYSYSSGWQGPATAQSNGSIS